MRRQKMRDPINHGPKKAGTEILWDKPPRTKSKQVACFEGKYLFKKKPNRGKRTSGRKKEGGCAKGNVQYYLENGSKGRPSGKGRRRFLNNPANPGKERRPREKLD